jgi:hypothetical protein
VGALAKLARRSKRPRSEPDEDNPRIVGIRPLGGILLVVPLAFLALGIFYLPGPWRLLSGAAIVVLGLLWFGGVFIPRR